MRSSHVLVLHALVLAVSGPEACAAQLQGGALVMLTQPFTDFVLKTFTPYVSREIKTLSIPDINTGSDGFDVSIKNIKIGSLDLSKATLAFKESQGLALDIPFTVSISADFEAKLHIWPHKPDATGSVVANANSGSHISGVVIVGASSNGHPTIDVNELNCALDLGISVHGSDWDWFINLMKKLFSGTIESEICGAATNAVQSVIKNTVTPSLTNLDMTLPLPVPTVLQAPGFEPALDVRISSQPVVTGSSIAIAARAEIINARDPPSPVSVPPTLATFAAASTHMLSAEVSTWAFNRALATFQAAHVLNWTLAATDLPHDSILQLVTNATCWKLSAPALNQLYPNMAMDVVVNATAAPTLQLANGTTTVTGPVSFKFRAVLLNGTRVPVFTLTCPLHTVANISITNASPTNTTAALHVSFATASCPLAVQSSAIGTVHETLMTLAMDYLTNDMMLPYANKELADGIQLPSYDNLTLAGPQMIIKSNTLFVDSNLQWR